MQYIELLIMFVSVLLAVAFLTVAERKTMGYMQRRVGPNAVGYLGVLMAIADAAKLLLKEIITPTHADKFILFLTRPPFDEVEAESELVSGHMTEYSSSIFVLFFLSEYAAILFLSTLTAILFFGGGTGIILALKANVFAYSYI
ncbi:nad1 (mitochondrion) [Candida pseudojiufengensis]|nr:nad1 [Candida pseudojiufengensis]